MYILVLIISLKSQFNHALDVRTQSVPYTTLSHNGKGCMDLGERISSELTSFNKDVETKYFCQLVQ